jgi:hypothetical protein
MGFNSAFKGLMYYNNEYNVISCYVKGKGKGKSHPITGHEDPERVQI